MKKVFIIFALMFAMPSLAETCDVDEYLNQDVCTTIDNGYYGVNCSGTLPQGYTHLEYIEGTGTQWIDTQYTPSIKTSFKVGLNMTQNTGNIIIGSDNGYRFFNASGKIYWDFNSSRIYGDTLNSGTYYDIEVGNNYVIKDGTLVLSGTIQKTIKNFPIEILSRLFGGTAAKGKIYYLKIYEDGELVRHFIPARRDKDNDIGMYESITDTFFPNNGTGEFVTSVPRGCNDQKICPAGHYCTNGELRGKCPAGKYSTLGATQCVSADAGYYVTGGNKQDIGHTSQTPCPVGYYCMNGIKTICPIGTYTTTTGNTGCTSIEPKYYGTNCVYPEYDGYSRLEYIESTGTQYINTEYMPTINTSFKFGVKMNETNGGTVIGNINNYRIFNASTRTYWDYNTSRLIGGHFLPGIYYDFVVGNNYVIQDGVRILSGTKQTYIHTPRPIYFFGHEGTAYHSAKGKIYYLKIYEDDKLVHDFIPARRNNDDTVGVYDTLTEKFYINNGTGTFIAGPSVSGCTTQSLCTAGSFCENGIRTKCTPGRWSSDAATICAECINAPENANYTTAEWKNENCPWVCDDEYGQTSSNTCKQLCTAGATMLRTNTGINVPLFASKNTTPSINIRIGNNICYVDLISGTAHGVIKVQYNGQTYHTTTP